MTMTKTEPHDSTTCTAGVDGQKCEMCQFAQESSRNPSKSPSEASSRENQRAGFLGLGPENASEPILTQSSPIPAPTFTYEWEAAPRSMTNYVEQSVAEWWFIRGQRAGELQSLTETTAVFRAMAERRGLNVKRNYH